ncbi:hypothetical protein GJW-30_1_01387 [Variibacter gotjawalensis]|uniref:Uncharacterized protein n=1 Tax=Variibacter gotjawalensis TaxID=1333996 RepID=A0A0S3PSL4_9BRAD|nr:hypothetical protein [Variibacter gotjawalensis]NIK49171.1 hypothetical protein [Variibacter gotjawalensis]RZS51026.1 hypothetical protein EV661_3498 [Variibacter gotjawalensis]BAT58860.1 hypothetical protein GJW-30_1_01387 [Variibacter gotjawalensis]
MRTHCKIFVGDAQTSLDGWFAVLPRVGEWVSLAGSDERHQVSAVHHRVAVTEDDDALVAIYLIKRDSTLL